MADSEGNREKVKVQTRITRSVQADFVAFAKKRGLTFSAYLEKLMLSHWRKEKAK